MKHGAFGGLIRVLPMMAVALLMAFAPLFPAHAQTPVCTTDTEYDTAESTLETAGIISRVIIQVQEYLADAGTRLGEGIVNDAGFRGAIIAAEAIMVAIFGILFMTGIVPLTAGEVTTRVLKIGLIGWVLGNWAQISGEWLYPFFVGGFDDLINLMIEMAVAPLAGGAANTAIGTSTVAGTPFYMLDRVIGMVLSPKMGTTLIAMLLTGPYGIGYFLFTIIALFMVFAAMLEAMWVYLLSLVVKALLIGIFPVFVGFLLFQRTRPLFDGWISQMINYSLQPLFMFLFLGLYTSLMTTALEVILNYPKCIACVQNILGMWADICMWRFTDGPGSTVPDPRPYNLSGPEGGGGPVFPIHIFNVLLFMMFAYLGWRSSAFMVTLAKDLSGGFVFLTQMPGAAASAFSNMAAQGRAGAAASVSGGASGYGQRTNAGPRAGLQAARRHNPNQ